MRNLSRRTIVIDAIEIASKNSNNDASKELVKEAWRRMESGCSYYSVACAARESVSNSIGPWSEPWKKINLIVEMLDSN